MGRPTEGGHERDRRVPERGLIISVFVGMVPKAAPQHGFTSTEIHNYAVDLRQGFAWSRPRILKPDCVLQFPELAVEKSVQHGGQVVVNTENDALNLENRMIKAHQPKYNVLLKDGKTYPWICVRNEAFPRVFLTRTVVKDGSDYFGPYTNLTVAKTMIELFEQLYHVRTCSLNLQQAMIDKGYKVCLIPGEPRSRKSPATPLLLPTPPGVP